jgi:3-oxo-5alpha-steroid 4-dehydrogenase
MSINNRFIATMTMTLGGLKVDEATGAVRRADGAAIPGLYAAGRTAVGLCSKGYLSGMSIADTVFSGRRAVRAALAAAVEKVSAG